MKILNQFQLDGDIVSCELYGNGHINDTYRVETLNDVYILQRINTHVFKKPELLMENIGRVTRFIQDKINKQGGDSSRESLTLIPTLDQSDYAVDEGGNYWRVYRFIQNTISYDLVLEVKDFYESGRAFGNFQYMLSDFPVSSLHSTIENFHHTPRRFEQFKKAVSNDVMNRSRTCEAEIQFILERESFMNTLWDLYDKGSLKLKVTHNDTKLNNVLLDADSGEGVCVIDLDTVMPGFALDDFGDSIRFGASTALEDERDLSKVHFDLDLYRAYVEGFVEGANGSLTNLEIELFPVGAKMMTLECGMRFLTDYLEGDVYFKTTDSMHNLARTRTQLKLVSDMEDSWTDMQAIASAYCL
ncbi:aminoglycoside phosphotransferase family protein [Erysipelothrix rhusiopathiae]|uniref:phosphotransferase enzyme family protein n=1 Tax=Erysipelothrix rhusiopathiae TaxID=1648 RepID=UPI000F434F25|nr:aminoglycoside phosphotransferase family protein [Erysipelothrix rhusiopathiae]AYV34112.1 aminoglycoside phosphotransferase family protein [Erysipelothrix rhusiopathiae]MDE8082431.1 aminoglycoside phosphotransferase family protein [Erysipelothrix rhusiopathiae]MDE8313780.1 aminoglycoside phosphotransferase family protein [Erysipelothrix rhusiopathiae]MDE8328939.1 aminoglycoside phosphotransferase family protein [Erysipelothrix rhusiopathiae]MDE8332071.1 aminoglycoside phosphotransferase fam